MFGIDPAAASQESFSNSCSHNGREAAAGAFVVHLRRRDNIVEKLQGNRMHFQQ
jgi:hypothetical protein